MNSSNSLVNINYHKMSIVNEKTAWVEKKRCNDQVSQKNFIGGWLGFFLDQSRSISVGLIMHACNSKDHNALTCVQIARTIINVVKAAIHFPTHSPKAWLQCYRHHILWTNDHALHILETCGKHKVRNWIIRGVNKKKTF